MVYSISVSLSGESCSTIVQCCFQNKHTSSMVALFVYSQVRRIATKRNPCWMEVKIHTIIPRSICWHALVHEVLSPAEPLGDDSHTEGGHHASDREDGHWERPERSECGLRNGIWVPLYPCCIILVLNNLTRKRGRCAETLHYITEICVRARVTW